MGKSLLILALAVGLAGCEMPAGEQVSDPHADQTCNSCHSGPQGERGRATVPEASCRSSGCHEAGGAQEVSVASVVFPHLDHAAGAAIEPGCAGCHTHDAGDEPLRASVDACALCHLGGMGSADAQECLLCHTGTDHAELTSQGVVVAHSELPWVEIGCVRCHYDVVSPETEVTGQPCRGCHEDMAVLNEEAVGRDLHPIHDAVNCTSCHQQDLHEVKAMSSVVDLVCSDCHAQEHGVPVAAGGRPASGLCGSCHSEVHSAQQRLILGVRPDGEVTPSAKFLAGITCRSCHIPLAAPAPSSTPVRGQAEACEGCHPSEYTEVLDWWLEGLEVRLASTGAYVDRADRRLEGASDSARALVGLARDMVSLVAEAGGQHNLELSDRLMREAVERTREAYQLAGVSAPMPPNLGRVPHAGLCSYCHYQSTSLDLRDMPEDFHRELFQPR